MRNVIVAQPLIAATLLSVVYSGSTESALATTIGSPPPVHQKAVVQVNHRRYWYPGYYPYYVPYAGYGAYYYAPPAVAYPPPVIYYPGPRYYPGPAVYGPDGVYVIRRPYSSYYDVGW